jgi:hypothetical protein
MISWFFGYLMTLLQEISLKFFKKAHEDGIWVFIRVKI